MKTARGIALVLALALACGDRSRGALIEQAVAIFEEIGVVMASVRDEVSARAAAPRVRALAERAYALRAEAEALKDQTGPAETQALREKYAPQIAAVSQRLMKQAVRVEAIPGGKELVDAMELDGP